MQLNSYQFPQAGASYAATPSSLLGDSSMQNQQSREAAVTPHSVLSAYMNIRSVGNGNSAADAARQTPSGQLPSQNGMAKDTYTALNPTTYATRLHVL